MVTSLPIRVGLNEFEQALLEQIDFSSTPGSLVAKASGRASRHLMESLYQRDAIPAVRHAYFAKPFPGGRGKSYLEVFQANLRGSKAHIFEDPTFVRRYVRYFIYGPDLPQGTIERFCQIADNGDGDALRSYVRHQAREAGAAAVRRELAEEFYKLALECFPSGSEMPRRIRDAAMQAR